MIPFVSFISSPSVALRGYPNTKILSPTLERLVFIVKGISPKVYPSGELHLLL
jgi:hypothetical protein